MVCLSVFGRSINWSKVVRIILLQAVIHCHILYRLAKENQSSELNKTGHLY